MTELFEYRRPVIVGCPDVTGYILAPAFFHRRTEIQIKLTIDDGPGFGLSTRRGTLRDCVRTTATVLGCLSFRIGFE